jgi:hypothetical protein
VIARERGRERQGKEDGIEGGSVLNPTTPLSLGSIVLILSITLRNTLDELTVDKTTYM